MKKLTAGVAFLILIASGSGGAWASQPSKFWVVPAVGIRTSTSFGIESEEAAYTRIRFDAGIAYGLSVGFRLTEYLSVEAMWSRQDTLVEGMIPGEDAPTYDQLFKAFEDLFQANLMVWAGYMIGPIKPYFMGGVGLTSINPRGDFSGTSRLSWSLGMGFETRISNRFGIRVQGKFVPTYINKTEEIVTEWVGGLEASSARNSITQWEFSAGLIIRF